MRSDIVRVPQTVDEDCADADVECRANINVRKKILMMGFIFDVIFVAKLLRKYGKCVEKSSKMVQIRIRT